MAALCIQSGFERTTHSYFCLVRAYGSLDWAAVGEVRIHEVGSKIHKGRMTAPPVPPYPAECAPGYVGHPHLDQPPPLPPLPPHPYISHSHPSPPPHPSTPLPAPRPHRLDPSLPANMARTLDNQTAAFQQPPYHDPYRGLSPRPPPLPQHPPPNYNPGCFGPQIPAHRISVQPPPNQNAWGPWNQSNSPAAIPLPASPRPPQHSYPHPAPHQPQFQSPSLHHRASVPAQLYGPPHQQPQMHPRSGSVQPSYAPPQAPSPSRQSGTPSLTAPLPAIGSLATALPTIQHPTHDPALKINWARDVLLLVDRAQQNPSGDTPPPGPVTIQDPQLLRLVQIAVALILQIASAQHPNPIPIFAAEAIYLRATFAASGAYPDHVPHNPRLAFRDFEQAARAGYAQAWFRLGRDYENFNDAMHARDCFERGVKLNVESCVYRMGMAHLMGQLGLPPQPEIGLPLIHRAATLASVQVPQPAYVYGLLLLGEFSHVTVPPQFFAPLIPPHSSAQQEARLHLERAAFLHFAPAQYKLGHAYEFALPPFPFDALLSVQYYSLASQQGEVEADMALSKWFLCGAEGAFDKDENLAFTFAEKSAKKGLPSAEFAMGYYKEVGVGGTKDIEAAQMWYQLASDHGNTDAVERLAALSQPSPQSLSRQEHDNITESKLVRKRTQAKQRSEREGGAARPSMEDGRHVVEVIRKNSTARHHAHGSGAAPTQFLPPVVEQPSQAMTPQIQQGLGAPLGPGPQAALNQQFPNQRRYTLVDPGANPTGLASPPPPLPNADSPSYARQAGRPPGQRTGSMPSPAPPQGGPQDMDGEASQQPPPGRHPPKGPTTFAEMGIQGVKLEEKECVIM
ncbi:HCP-like protein [Butyriboletus roseoflavus]|nr:HCP-like protein [Butyriboletus roseoflavus]